MPPPHSPGPETCGRSGEGWWPGLRSPTNTTGLRTEGVTTGGPARGRSGCRRCTQEGERKRATGHLLKPPLKRHDRREVLIQSRAAGGANREGTKYEVHAASAQTSLRGGCDEFSPDRKAVTTKIQVATNRPPLRTPCVPWESPCASPCASAKNVVWNYWRVPPSAYLNLSDPREKSDTKVVASTLVHKAKEGCVFGSGLESPWRARPSHRRLAQIHAQPPANTNRSQRVTETRPTHHHRSHIHEYRL